MRNKTEQRILRSAKYWAARFARTADEYEDYYSLGCLGGVESPVYQYIDKSVRCKISSYRRNNNRRYRCYLRYQRLHRRPHRESLISLIDIKDLVSVLITKCTPKEKELIELKYWKGHTYIAIAEFYGVTPTCVRLWHRTLLSKLKGILLRIL